MERRTRSPDFPNMRHRRYRRSRSNSRSRSRSRDRRRKYSRSRSRERIYRNDDCPDIYRDNIDQEYHNDRDARYYNRSGDRKYNPGDRGDRFDRFDRNDRGDRGDRRERRNNYHRGRDYSSDESNDSYGGDVQNVHYRNQVPSNKVIILGIAQHITDADINASLFQCGIQPLSIRLIRKHNTGVPRGFAFVEFSTEEEATRWMEYKQGVLMLPGQNRTIMQYSYNKHNGNKEWNATDWYCVKCGVFNFKRRENCFRCSASREESEKGGEGSDEISSILTKKILLRNLDVLTNEESVLTSMQQVVPTLVSKISKILICRDPLTSTSRGICYLCFENLVDSMNVFTALKSLQPPLLIDSREIIINYCVDAENKQIIDNSQNSSYGNNLSSAGHFSAGKSSGSSSAASASNYRYTLADVPRLAEYSAGVYAQTTAEYEHYYRYYSDYYTTQINAGQFSNLPTISQIGGETANSGAAVALSAIQRKQKQSSNGKPPFAVAATLPTSAVLEPIQVPNGTDGRTYPTPDISSYQYDETSGYYYDSSTGLYYDSNSTYYFNTALSAYLYWDQARSTYVLAPDNHSTTYNTQAANVNASPTVAGPSAAPIESKSNDVSAADTNDNGKKKDAAKDNDQRHDKVKVAKKIVKDMEKWAKQLNQKKDMNVLAAPVQVRDEPVTVSKPIAKLDAYADVGFSILENRDRLGNGRATAWHSNGSDSETEQQQHPQIGTQREPLNSDAKRSDDLVNFEQLTCMLCKRAFQSLDILNKHLKMSKLHKENLQKYEASRGSGIGSGEECSNRDSDSMGGDSLQSYRDRAKERRLKYGETDPPPVNRSRERYEREFRRQSAQLEKQNSMSLASKPIGESNVGNRLLQKMGWSEGQGLGRKNQGRTDIIEAESRNPVAGLGTKSTSFAPGDDYKSYIKRMMKARYEQAE